MWTHFQQLNAKFWGAALAALLLSLTVSSGAVINLSAYAYIALLNSDGTAPLADGSTVQIIGSYDDVIDPMSMIGSNYTFQTTGDDIILATITIDSSQLGSNGTFYVGNIYYESDDIKNMYVRFYDTIAVMTGMIYWGESPMTNVEYDAHGSIVVDFVGGYSTTNTGNFVVIPEPSAFNLSVICFGILAAIRNTLREDKRKKRKHIIQRLLEPQESFPINTYDRF
ncbi:MAG: hypothetical protein M5U15_07750 [Kiritimatiellae bacterium]|nr:hypothetical protein [Kiritimatiellia bacterium]